jgi:PKHD-type hydroxylase
VFRTYQIYTEDEVNKIFDAIKGEKWEQGKARTEELTGTIKKNEELTITTSKMVHSLMRNHAKLLADNKEVNKDHIVHQVSPPKLNKFSGGDSEYKRHADSPLMTGTRTDLACTTFMVHPDTYEGGELNVEDEWGVSHSFKGKLGEAVIYPCGAPHWVNPVTSGERIAIICWIQSWIQDSVKRSLVTRMIKGLRKIEGLTHEDELIREVWTELGSIQSQIFKMWSR